MTETPDPGSTDQAANLARQIPDSKGPAPVHLWNPPYCGELDMRIAADGTWHYQGSPINRKRMVKLFSSVLRLDDDDHYYLVTPVEKVRIQVEDCPFVAQLLSAGGEGRDRELVFTTNTDEEVVAGPGNPIEVTTGPDGQPHPVLLVRTNLYALIHRNVFYQLVDLAEAKTPPGDGTDSVVGVWSRGEFFELGSPDQD